MSERATEYVMPALAVSATLPTDDIGNATIRLDGAGLALFEVTAVSGLTGTVEVLSAAGGTWRQWDAWQRAAGGQPVKRDAGTTITFVAGDIITVGDVYGFRSVRIKRAGGTSATFTARTGENAIAFSLQRSITVVGTKATKTFAFTRPANATAYAAKDVVGPAQLTVTGVTNATPAVVTCGTHGLTDGDPVTIASAGGATGVNGNFFAGVATGGGSSTTFAVYSDAALTTAVAAGGAYTSGGTVERLLVWQDLARLASGSGYIVKATIQTDQTTNTSSFRLHLFNTIQSAIADNAACTAPLYAQAAGYVGTIDFGACVVEGTGATAAYNNITTNSALSKLPLAYNVGASPDLYGILEVIAAFTPASGQQFTIKLSSEND